MADLIQIIPAAQIDRIKWDRCVRESNHGLIYSFTDYLNSMAENWHGLVIDDYTAVMALPWKTKLGIRYGYMPAFMQQSGIIGDIGDIDLTKVFDAIHGFLSFADIHFNYANTSFQNILPVITRTNLVIDLTQDFNSIRSAYKNDLRENIKKAEILQLDYTPADIEAAVSSYHLHYSKRIPHIQKNDYRNFLQLCRLLEAKGQCLARSVSAKDGILLATAIFLKDEKRIYNIMNTTLPQGRDMEANHFLLDRVISEFAGQPLLFDFEGSELPGVQAFYKKFGGVNQPYFHYHYNGLPWPLRLLKR